MITPVHSLSCKYELLGVLAVYTARREDVHYIARKGRLVHG
jgi:hypothetical protein